MRLVPRSRVKPDEVLDGLITAVVSLDEELRVTSVNSAFESLLSVSRKHAVGEPLITAIPPFAPHAARLEHALANATGFIERELPLQRPGEQAITVDCTVTPLMLAKKPGLLMELLPLDRHLRI